MSLCKPLLVKYFYELFLYTTSARAARSYCAHAQLARSWGGRGMGEEFHSQTRRGASLERRRKIKLCCPVAPSAETT